MPKVRLDPKFVYSNSTFDCSFRIHPTGPYNWNLWTESDFNQGYALYVPKTGLIPLGNSHSERHGNRITVTSIRLKSIITLDYIWQIYNMNVIQANASGSEPSLTSLSNTLPITRFMKLRYFVVEFDEDLAINDQQIYRWFKRTYCWYRPNVNAVGEYYQDAPVSVHSNVLHETTEWTGKFNILCDKCITLNQRHPQISLDITVPLNRQFVYREDDTTGEHLLFPNLWIFVMPPLSQEVDMDPCSSMIMYNYARQSTVGILPAYHVKTFTKLSFIDL